MERHILNDFRAEVTYEKVLKRFKMSSENENADELFSLFEAASKIARPKAIYAVAAVEEAEDCFKIDDILIENKFVKLKLEGKKRVFPYVATCGTEIQQWFENIDDPILKYWADGICEMYLHAAFEHLFAAIKGYMLPEAKLTALNPGSLPQWPLSEQRVLFSILGDVKEAIGVDLTESYLMIPFKSISGIYFATASDYENCMYCKMEKCPGRRACFDDEALQKMLQAISK